VALLLSGIYNFSVLRDTYFRNMNPVAACIVGWFLIYTHIVFLPSNV
jgi:hypothetical protein